MRPEDLLNAIGEVDDAYIKKAHRRSFLITLLIFTVVVFTLSALVVSQVPDFHLLMRYNPDGTVNTGYIEPEVLTQNKWTSMEYTAYADGEVVSTTQFRVALSPDYTITHTTNGTTTRIVGSNGDSDWPDDYLERAHYANRYLHTYYGKDLIDRVEMMTIHTGVAYGSPDQKLNHLQFSYLDRGNLLLEQTKLGNDTIVGIRSNATSNGKVSGWKEWDPDWNLLAYAEYAYEGNVQTVSTHLADGTLTGTRVSHYRFDKLRMREYYDANGTLTGKEVYHYRPWEIFFCLQGYIILFFIICLAATAALPAWESRIRLGDRVVPKWVAGNREETGELLKEVKELRVQITELSEKLTTSDCSPEDIAALTGELGRMNETLENLLDDQQRRKP